MTGDPISTAPRWLRHEYSIDTPENVTFGYPLAGPGSRLIAAAVDLLLVVLGNVFLQYVAWFVLALLSPEDLWSDLDQLSLDGGLLIALYVLLNFLLFWAYFIGFELRWNGQTPGKRLAGLRVVRLDGTPAGVLEIVVRNLVRLVDLLPFFYALGAVVVVSNRHSRRLGDFAAGTLVIRTETARTAAQLATPPVLPAETVPADIQFVPSVRNLAAEEYQLVCAVLAGEAAQRVNAGLVLRLAVALALKLGYPPPTEATARSFLQLVAAAYQQPAREGEST